MNLITISQTQINDEAVQTVNARELHGFLEVGKVFAAWIQERIEQYDFMEGVDFVVFSETGNNPSGGRPSKEYALTLDMAKELAMVERNAKGKQARRYFIECERKAKQAHSRNLYIPQNYPDALRLAATFKEQLDAAAMEVEKIKQENSELKSIISKENKIHAKVRVKLDKNNGFIKWNLLTSALMRYLKTSNAIRDEICTMEDVKFLKFPSRGVKGFTIYVAYKNVPESQINITR